MKKTSKIFIYQFKISKIIDNIINGIECCDLYNKKIIKLLKIYNDKADIAR